MEDMMNINDLIIDSSDHISIVKNDDTAKSFPIKNAFVNFNKDGDVKEIQIRVKLKDIKTEETYDAVVKFCGNFINYMVEVIE